MLFLLPSFSDFSDYEITFDLWCEIPEPKWNTSQPSELDKSKACIRFLELNNLL